MNFSRRDTFKCLLALSAAGTALGLQTAAAKAAGDYMLKTEASSSPTRTPRLFRTSEHMVGSPTSFLPQASIFKTASSGQYIKQLASSSRRFREIVDEFSGLSPIDQIESVNRFANSFPYKSDQKHYGRMEKWVLPERFFSSGGDCEDYAIAKAATLRALGFHPDRMRLILLEDQKIRQYHAILGVYYSGDIYILDNQLKNVVTSSDINYYAPICSMTHQNLWVHWRNIKSKSKRAKGMNSLQRMMAQEKLKMLRHSGSGSDLLLN